MKLELLSKKDNIYNFVIKDTSKAYSNALRRIMLTEVPVMAIEEVEFKNNSSALYDEMIAHRMGFIPLTTDLSSYEMPKTKADIEERSAKSTLTLTLKEKGPKTVYASDLKTADPKVKPVFPKIPIATLLKDQELELTAVAVMGKGLDHAKWSPGHVWYTYKPTITIGKKDAGEFKDLYPPQIFNDKGEIDEKLIIENNLVDAVAHVNNDVIAVDYDDTQYLFYVESWGQLQVQEIVEQALDVFDAKLDELSSKIE